MVASHDMSLFKSIVVSIIDRLPDLANILLSVVGVFMSFPKLAERIEEDSRLRITIAVACTLVGVGAFVVSGQQRQQSDSDMKRLLVNTKTSVDETHTVVNQSKIALDSLNENLKTQTGGDSFCYAGLNGISEQGVGLVLVTQGKYPLYDVQVQVTDVKVLRVAKDIQKSTLLVKQIGNMGIKIARPLGDVPFSSAGDTQALNIFFSGRNGFWTQLMRLRKINGNWERATIVSGSLDERFPNGAILEREISKGFPVRELKNDSDWKGVEKLPDAF